MAETRKLIDLLNLTTDYFEEKQIENPRLNAELLVGSILRLSRVQLYLNFEKPIQENEIEQIRAAIQRRANHEPLQYIIGETEFYSLKFKVNRHTLIPRPETELLVETVSEEIKNITDCSVLDIGTGSGNIIISLANETSDSNYIGIDIDENIVAVARENAALHDLADKIRFLVGDIFDPKLEHLLDRKLNVIASNPPYIPESDFSELPTEIREFEPHSALAGGDDGLKYYRRIAEISTDLLLENGIIALELGMGQADAVEKILQQSGFADIKVKKDLNGIDRVVIARANN